MTDSGAERAARKIASKWYTAPPTVAEVTAIIREETGTQSAKLRDFLNVIISNGATLAYLQRVAKELLAVLPAAPDEGGTR